MLSFSQNQMITFFPEIQQQMINFGFNESQHKRNNMQNQKMNLLSPRFSNCPSFLIKSKSQSKFDLNEPNRGHGKSKLSLHPNELLKSLELNKSKSIQLFKKFSSSDKLKQKNIPDQHFTDLALGSKAENIKTSLTTIDSETDLPPYRLDLVRNNATSFTQQDFSDLIGHQLGNKKAVLFGSSEKQNSYRNVFSLRYSGCTDNKNQSQAYSERILEPTKKTQTKIQDFEFLREIGKGFCSTVYLARHRTLNMLFAIKVLSKQLIKQHSLEEHIFRELKIHSFLKHANIVSLYKIINGTKNIYMVMEYAPSGSLYSQLKKQHKFSEGKTATVVRDIAQGLKVLHDNNITHRDLKLENILISGETAKIGDFGCSVNGIAMRKSLVGSPVYFSPEQLNHNFYSNKTDIWQVGVMTYEMLFGVTPFEKEVIKALNQGQLRSELKLSFPSFMKVSPEARDFLQKCLQQNQNRRLTVNQVLSHPFLLSSSC